MSVSASCVPVRTCVNVRPRLLRTGKNAARRSSHACKRLHRRRETSGGSRRGAHSLIVIPYVRYARVLYKALRSSVGFSVCVRVRRLVLTENMRVLYVIDPTSYVSFLHPETAPSYAHAVPSVRRGPRTCLLCLLATLRHRDLITPPPHVKPRLASSAIILCEPPPLSAEALLCAAVRLHARPFDVSGLGVRTRLSEANECLLITMLSLS